MLRSGFVVSQPHEPLYRDDDERERVRVEVVHPHPVGFDRVQRHGDRYDADVEVREAPSERARPNERPNGSGLATTRHPEHEPGAEREAPIEEDCLNHPLLPRL